MDLEYKASMVITPGGVKTLITETPGWGTLTTAKEPDERPSRPAISTTAIEHRTITRNPTPPRASEPPTAKRKLSPATPSGQRARSHLFPPKKKPKDGCWTEPPNHLDPLQLPSTCNSNQVQTKPDPGHHHRPAVSINQSPSQFSTIPDQFSYLRSLRDDIINQLGQQHAKTIRELGKKIDHLSKQNAELNKKMNSILQILKIPDQARKDNTPTPPFQLPSLLNVGGNVKQPKPPPPPVFPPPAQTVIPSQNWSQEPHPQRDYQRTERDFDGETMSLDQMASYSSPEPPNLKLSKGPQRVSSIPAYPDNRNQSNSNVQEPHEDRKHFAWLKKQFEQCFGLSTDSTKGIQFIALTVLR